MCLGRSPGSSSSGLDSISSESSSHSLSCRRELACAVAARVLENLGTVAPRTRSLRPSNSVHRIYPSEEERA